MQIDSIGLSLVRYYLSRCTMPADYRGLLKTMLSAGVPSGYDTDSIQRLDKPDSHGVMVLMAHRYGKTLLEASDYAVFSMPYDISVEYDALLSVTREEAELPTEAQLDALMEIVKRIAASMVTLAPQ